MRFIYLGLFVMNLEKYQLPLSLADAMQGFLVGLAQSSLPNFNGKTGLLQLRPQFWEGGK